MSSESSDMPHSLRQEPEGLFRSGGTAPSERVVPGALSELYKPMSARSANAPSDVPRLESITPGSLLDSTSPEITDRQTDGGADAHNILEDDGENGAGREHTDNVLHSAVTEECSSSVHSGSSSCLDSTAQMLAAATLPDGRIDYDTLKRLRREERHRYRQKLDRERIRRYALEKLILNTSVVDTTLKAAHDRTGSSMSDSKASVSSHTSDTSAFLLDMIRTRMSKRRKQERSGSRTGDHSAARTPTPQHSAQLQQLPTRVSGDGMLNVAELPQMQPAAPTTQSAAENYYESTSLFSVYPEPNAAAASVKENRYESATQSLDTTKRPPISAAPVRQKVGTDAPTAAKKPSDAATKRVPPSMKQVFAAGRSGSRHGWWWVGMNGVPSSSIPQLSPTPKARESSRCAFVRRSRARLRAIQHASEQRRALAELHRQCAAQVAAGEIRLEDAMLLYEQPEYTVKPPRAFSKQDMEIATRRRVIQLPEYQAKLLRQERTQELATNRVCAAMYKQKLAYYRQVHKNCE